MLLLTSTGCPVLSTTTARNSASSSSSTSGTLGKGSCIVKGVLEVDIAGGREVPLIGVCELHVLGLITCEGIDIVQSDHAPEAGVAQVIFHGILVRHHGRNQEEVEERLEKEVERDKEEDAQTTTCTCMDGMR